MPTLGTPIPIGVTQDEKNALKGTDGTPSDSNRFVTNSDARVNNPATATPTTIEPDDAGAVGTATLYAREDHEHPIACDAPAQGIGASNAEGDASTFARSNHDHLIRTTNGPQDLSVGDIPDNYALIRSGTSIVGVNPYNPDRAVVVAKTALGADATSIADAITKANALSPAPSASAPAVIVVHPGVYSTPPFTLPNYVSLVGVGGAEAVILDASTATSALCTTNGGGHRIEGLTLRDANGVGGVGIAVGGTSGTPVIADCRIENCETGVKCDGSSYAISLRNVTVDGGTTGVLVNGSGAIGEIDHVTLIDQTTGLDLGASGGTVTGTDLRVVDDSGFTLHVRVQASTSLLELMNSVFRTDKTDFNASATVHLSFGSDVPGDPAYKIIGELHVGSEARPHESCFGGGDSHTRGMAAFTNTNGEAGTWNDITTQLRDLDSSPATLFAGTGVGNCFYLGGDFEFPGIKAAVTTARSGGVLALEYWNGSAWTAIAHLSSDASSPYAQYAQDVFSRVSSEQIRFADRPSWATKSLNGTTKYWVRFRVTTALTTSPAADQCKLHTDRTEINSDGTVELFGAAEARRQIIWHRRLMEEMEGFAQPNENVDIATNLSIVGLNNRYQDGNKDGSIEIVHAPPGLDTSRPLILQVGWYKNAAGTGNVELQADVVLMNEGDVINGTLPYAQQLSQIVAVDARSPLELIITDFQIALPDLEQDGSFALALYRDAGGGNLDDTFNEDCTHIFSRLYGTFWR